MSTNTNVPSTYGRNLKLQLLVMAIPMAMATASTFADTAIMQPTWVRSGYSLDDWRLDTSSGHNNDGITAGQGLTLHNQTEDAALVYGKRGRFGGVNLVWDYAHAFGGLNNVTLSRPGEAQGPIHYGERVAIHIKRGGYLRYGKRAIGINLVWDKYPVFDWRVDGGPAGTIVSANTPVQLYNLTTRDRLVYCPRLSGINLRWARDCQRSGDVFYPPILNTTPQ